MRYLGLDLGTTTCGVSITDKTNTIVSPLKLIKFAREDYDCLLTTILNIISEYNIDVVILGMPKNMDNTLGFAAQRSLNFKKLLESKDIQVKLQDERLSSVEAINILKNNNVKKINKQNKTDLVAACIILDTYLKKVHYDK